MKFLVSFALLLALTGCKTSKNSEVVEELKSAEIVDSVKQDFGKAKRVSPSESLYEKMLVSISNGDFKGVQQCLQKGASVNGEDGFPPLVAAAQMGHLSIVRLLLDNGADVNATALHSFTALMVASGEGYCEIVKALLDYGADVNYSYELVGTALVIAATKGHVEIVELLLNHGANIESKTLMGESALLRALMFNHPKIAKLLIQRGADVNVQHEISGWSPLHLASRKGYEEIVKILISKNADVDLKDSNSATALIYATANGNIEIIRSLLWSGVDVNAKFKIYKTLDGTVLDFIEFFLKNDKVEIFGTPVKYNIDRKKLVQIKELLRAYGAKFLSELK